MNKKFFFQPEKKMWKQGFQMQDETDQIVYEAKVLKQSILGSQTVEFINHLTNKSEEHKIGAVVTTQTESGGLTNLLSTKSRFKLDGKNIWDYLHEKGIRIDSGVASGRLGMSYTISLKGDVIAAATTSSPNGGKSIITSRYCYEVDTEAEYLDLVFLTIYAIAKTEQTFYQ